MGNAVADLYAIGRGVIGGALVARPQLAARWVGEPALDPDVHATIRSFGARDALLAAAVLASRDRPDVQRGALLVCVSADALDAVVEAADYVRTRRPAAGIATLTALGGVVMGLVAARLSASRRPPLPSR
jgi:hypothetical protein